MKVLSLAAQVSEYAAEQAEEAAQTAQEAVTDTGADAELEKRVSLRMSPGALRKAMLMERTPQAEERAKAMANIAELAAERIGAG